MTVGADDGAPSRVMDIGGSHVTAALVEHDGGVSPIRRRFDATIDPGADTRTLLDAIAAPGEALTREHGPGSWSVALPGPFDYAVGAGTFAGVEKFQSLAGVDLRAALSGRWSVGPESIRFLNDAEAYGVGEWASGATGRPARMVCITLGTGVGSAFLDEGRAVSSGPGVPRDGAVHTLRIDGRPLEETISSPALRARYAVMTGTLVSVERLCAAAREGEPSARDVVDGAMLALGRALAPCLTAFGASHLVVGGGIARSWDVIAGPLRRGVDSTVGADAVPRAGLALSPAVLQDSAPLIGAAVWGRRPGSPRD